MFYRLTEQFLKIGSDRGVPQELDRPCTDGVRVGGPSWGQLVEAVNLEMAQSISNGIVSACNMGYKDMYVILCCTKVKHANKSYQFRAVGGSLVSNVHYCLIVTMHQYLFSWPLVAPGVNS